MKAKEVFPKIKIALILFFGFMILYYAGTNMSMRGMLNSVRLPSYAERILQPKTGYFDCCAGARIGIEEVYRIPLDKVSDISYGEEKGVVVEPYEESCLLNDLSVRMNDFEHDCSYVYDYGDVMSLPGYRDNDGYCYIHVWGRKYLGSGDSFTLYLFSVISIFFILPAVILYVVLKRLAYKGINKLRNRSVKDMDGTSL